MAGFERVLSGRPSRHPEPWVTGGAVVRGPAPAAQPELRDPLQDPDVQAVLAEARRQAEEQGYATGQRQAEAELAAAVAAAQGFAHKLETAVPKDVDMLARTVAELAVLIARRILAAELRHDPSVLIAAIEAGLRQAAGASTINVELHPMVVDAVERVWTARHGTRHRGFSWSFSADPTLPADGCRLRTEHGLVEAGFEDQLAEVAAALDAAIPGYLGAALGPTADAADAAEAAEVSRSAVVAPAARPVAPAAPAASAAAPIPSAFDAPAFGVPAVAVPAAFDAPAFGVPASPSSDLGAVLGIPDDLDLDALANLGLDDLANLGLDGLESLGTDGPA